MSVWASIVETWKNVECGKDKTAAELLEMVDLCDIPIDVEARTMHGRIIRLGKELRAQKDLPHAGHLIVPKTIDGRRLWRLQEKP